MSEKHAKDIVNAVEQTDVYIKALEAASEKEKTNVKATLEDFAKLLSPIVETVEMLETSEEVIKAVRERLAEKLGGR